MIVTDDPTLLARLRSRYEELGSHKLAEYAFTLGLFPPHHRKGATDSISEYWPPGADTSAPGLLVWDSTFTDAFEEHDDEDDEDDEDDDPWGSAGPPGSAGGDVTSRNGGWTL
ncbi:hypothetical protein [Stackebrandtia albiflava]|uniref:hypothetical protein n=1 Tax=Stackebrandtia albiflava TaxID=406432 RepID=UPI0011BE22CF|nr:hypothetical protein [Stackebrandtia albiflava]